MNPSKTNVIVGKNKQGKTSILKAIKAAFDGKADHSFIHDGEGKAEITIQLDDLMQIRRTITEKGTYLDVSNEQGFKVPSPQKFLDGMIGTFSFNPVQFFELKPADRKKYLLNAIKLTITKDELAGYIGTDVSLVAGFNYDAHALEVVEAVRKGFYDQRTVANAEVTKKRKALDEMSAKIPEGFDPSTVSEEKITQLRNAIQEDEKAKLKQEEHERWLAGLQKQEVEKKERIEALKAELAKEEASLADIQKEIVGAADFHYDFSDEMTITSMKETLAKLEGQREMVFTHKRVQELRGELDTAVQEADKLDTIVTQLTKEVPQKLIEKAQLPVEGLTVSTEDILVNGVSLDNLSTSEQLKFALNITRKLNETFKVICIDGIETLDKENFEVFLKEIEGDDYQYFVTRVDGNVEGGIVIEDGNIKDAGAAPQGN